MNIKYTYCFLLLLLASAFLAYPGVGQEAEIEPSALTISGTIEDNYTNLTYTLVFDNTDSDTDKSGYQEIQFPRNLYLSNVTAKMGDKIYYGVVKEESQAEEEYEEAVEQNKTAILVKSLGDHKYGFELNVESKQRLILSAIVEGFNTRRLGTYRIDIINFQEGPRMDFDVDVDFYTSLSTYKTIKLLGLGPATITPLSLKNGFNIQFHQVNYLFSQSISIEYVLSEMVDGGKLLGYTNGEEDYFVYLLAPEIQNPDDQTAKEYVFVIDKSGSMRENDRIDKAKEAFTTIIDNLNAKDRFNVIAFEALIDPLWEVSKEGTTSNIDEAKSWVDNLRASGGTNIDSALEEAFSSFDNEFTASKALTLLSDGEPTAGETDEVKIRYNAQNYNTEEVAVFTIAFGEATSEGLMASLAYDTGGNFEKILDSVSSTENLLNFYEEFSTPIATGFNISYTNAVEVSPSPNSLKGPLFNGSEVLQTGKFSGPLTINTEIHFNTQTISYTNEILEPQTDLPHIERIWAVNRINDLVNIANIEGSNETLRNQIVSLSIEYGIVVGGYTALIIVIDSPDEPVKTTNEGIGAPATYVNTQIGIEQEGIADAGGHLDLNFVLAPLILVTLLAFKKRRK